MILMLQKEMFKIFSFIDHIFVCDLSDVVKSVYLESDLTPFKKINSKFKMF